MQLLATADQMQAFDRAAIQTLGIPGSILMENAGRAFVEVLATHVSPLSDKRIVVLCGKGNNGGDGFVIARHLLNSGAYVAVVLLAPRRESKGDAKLNLEILMKLKRGWKGKLTILNGVSGLNSNGIGRPDIIIDAIFGTGFKGVAAGNALKAILWANGQACYRASVDICSGADASTGDVAGESFHAHMTVTLGLGKVGQYLSPARESSGEVVPVEISIPEFLFDRKVIHTLRIQREDVAGRLSKRSPVAHKYSVGKVFVLAGSTKFTGAAFLSAQSSLKAGAGAVVLGTPNTVAPVLSRKFNEVIVEPLESTGAGSIALGARDKILERIQWADAVVLGPGLSRNEETVKLLRELIIETYKPLVLDADALFALAGHLNLLKQRTTPTILTPHTGELGMLTGEEPNSIERRRVEAAREAARRFQCIVCLKGNPTVTAEPYGTAILNSSGNPGMATIGSGDVLAGVIGSFLAQRIELIMSACSAVFVHGLAGDLARSKFGERSVLASDILNSLPNVLQGLETT